MLNNDKYLIEAIEADRMPGESADQIMSYLTTSYKSTTYMIDIDAFARTKGSMGLLTGGPSMGKSMSPKKSYECE